MRMFKVIQIYRVPAGSKREALEKVLRGGDLREYHSEIYAVEEQDRGWLGALRRQVLGGRK